MTEAGRGGELRRSGKQKHGTDSPSEPKKEPRLSTPGVWTSALQDGRGQMSVILSAARPPCPHRRRPWHCAGAARENACASGKEPVGHPKRHGARALPLAREETQGQSCGLLSSLLGPHDRTPQPSGIGARCYSSCPQAGHPRSRRRQIRCPVRGLPGPQTAVFSLHPLPGGRAWELSPQGALVPFLEAPPS